MRLRSLFSLYLLLTLTWHCCAGQEIIFRFLDAPLSDQYGQHYAVRPASGSVLRSRLVVIFPGTNGKPRNYIRFSDLAARNGFHVLTLAYPNSESARYFCQNGDDLSCYGRFRQEVLTGVDQLKEYSVVPEESIMARLEKALQALVEIDPTGEWEEFLEEGKPVWSRIIAGGHSQGAGHAAFLAHSVSLNRVLLFAGPNDFHTSLNLPAGWCSEHSATSPSRFRAFLHAHDNLVPVEEQLTQLKAMGMHSVPATFHPGEAVPADARILLSRLDPGSPFNHISLVIDSHTPLQENGKPLYEGVWKWMLGIAP